MTEKKCEHCYKYVGENQEHMTVPIRDLSFLVLNLYSAFNILKAQGHEFNKEELITMDKLWETYSAPIHWNGSGRFYDMPKEKYDNFKYQHKSYI